MENVREKKQRKIIGFLCVVCFLLAVSSVRQSVMTARYRRLEKALSEKAVSSLCESLDSISVSLFKGVYSGDARALSEIGNELCREASAAKENLSMLSPDDELCAELYKFLSQVGNFTIALAEGKETISAADGEKLIALTEYAEKLSEKMNEICTDYYNGDVSLVSALGNLENSTENLPDDFYTRVSDAAQTMTDYPTLVYDGPFADSLSRKKSVFLEKESELTADEAKERAGELLGVPASALRRDEDVNSGVELFCFSKSGIDVGISKRGGYLCYLMSDSYAYEETISTDEAIKRGREYLERLGYENMESSYYSVYDGICTINFASTDEGVICYPDLIKVSIALDTGKLVGFDARTYLLNHREREVDNAVITKQQAVKKLSPLLEVRGGRTVIIPLDTGEEALCYEFRCSQQDGRELLVYVDALTGQQRDILILLYSDGGILTK